MPQQPEENVDAGRTGRPAAGGLGLGGGPAADAGARWLRTDRVLLATALALLVYAIGEVLLLVFAGIAIAVALDGLARAVAARLPIGRGWALLSVSLLMLALLAGFVAAVVPQVVAQFREMQETLVTFIEHALDWLSGVGVGVETLGLEEDGPPPFAEAAGAMFAQVAAWGMTTLGALTSLVVIFVIAGFAAADPDLYRQGLLRLLPHARRGVVDDALSAVARSLRWWFLSQLVSMLLLGVTVSLGLWVLGIDLWLGLGVLTALLTFIPYLGPTIAAIPILAIAFADGVETGLIVGAFYLAVQNIEANVIVPWIQHKVVHLAPVLAIAVQVLMGLLFGLPGVILAAPVTVVGMVMVQKLWMEAVLGERLAS